MHRAALGDGVGYNVVGELPGKARNGQMLLITAHHDCYWRGGLDNTSGVAQALTIAKAAKLSGFEPQRTWRTLTSAWWECATTSRP